MDEYTKQMEDRVQLGISWLNTNFPGWELRVDLNKFNVNNESKCPCYYASGEDFWKMIVRLGIFEGRQYEKMGFIEWNKRDEMNEIWKSEIKKLKEMKK